MIESFFLKAAKSFLSEYIDGFQDKDLAFSILKGKAAVHNCLLNTKKLDELLWLYNVPFKVKLGFVEDVELDVTPFSLLIFATLRSLFSG